MNPIFPEHIEAGLVADEGKSLGQIAFESYSGKAAYYQWGQLPSAEISWERCAQAIAQHATRELREEKDIIKTALESYVGICATQAAEIKRLQAENTMLRKEAI